MRLQAVLYGFHQSAFQHTGFECRVISVVREDVPAPEDQVVEFGEGDEVLNEGNALIGALPQSNGPHLGQRANGWRQLPSNGFNSGDESRCHGSHAWNQDAKFSFRFFNAYHFPVHGSVPPQIPISR